MNAIVKAWRNFKIRVTKRRQSIGVENKFQLGDWVTVKDQSFDLAGSKFYSVKQRCFSAGEVVDAFYGFNMNTGWRWNYEVQYKRRETVIVLYEEHEICIDVAWIRNQKLKKLGI
jgi:hypothetical protein